MPIITTQTPGVKKSMKMIHRDSGDPSEFVVSWSRSPKSVGTPVVELYTKDDESVLDASSDSVEIILTPDKVERKLDYKEPVWGRRYIDGDKLVHEVTCPFFSHHRFNVIWKPGTHGCSSIACPFCAVEDTEFMSFCFHCRTNLEPRGGAICHDCQRARSINRIAVRYPSRIPAADAGGAGGGATLSPGYGFCNCHFCQENFIITDEAKDQKRLVEPLPAEWAPLLATPFNGIHWDERVCFSIDQLGLQYGVSELSEKLNTVFTKDSVYEDTVMKLLQQNVKTGSYNDLYQDLQRFKETEEKPVASRTRASSKRQRTETVEGAGAATTLSLIMCKLRL